MKGTLITPMGYTEALEIALNDDGSHSVSFLPASTGDYMVRASLTRIQILRFTVSPCFYNYLRPNSSMFALYSEQNKDSLQSSPSLYSYFLLHLFYMDRPSMTVLSTHFKRHRIDSNVYIVVPDRNYIKGKTGVRHTCICNRWQTD